MSSSPSSSKKLPSASWELKDQKIILMIKKTNEKKNKKTLLKHTETTERWLSTVFIQLDEK